MSEVEIVVGRRDIRTVNEEIQAAVGQGYAVFVRETLSRHNLGVGLPAGAKIRFEGSVGYYCGGLNNGAEISIERNSAGEPAKACLVVISQ